MSDDDRFDDLDNEHGKNEIAGPPASVIFMEMMRRAAAGPQSDDVVEPETLQDGIQDVESPADQLPPTKRGPYSEEALEAQRVRRVKRRKERRRRRTVGIVGGLLRSLIVVGVSGMLIATILSWGTTPQSLDTQLRNRLGEVSAAESAPTTVPTVLPTPNWLRRIGILSGHLGPENDPGAVCDDGLTEREINFAVAQTVVLELRRRGYTVDLLEEFDDRMTDYRAAAVVSIHANDCRDYGEYVSGFLVSQAEARPVGGVDTRLVECLAEHYRVITGLERRYGLTRDMTDYHIFRNIHVTTPGAIIELGFMRDDREILTTRPDMLARGIVDGILCFLEPGDQDLQEIEPAAVPTDLLDTLEG